MIKQYSRSDLNSFEITKGDIFEYCNFSFDYNVPQDWLNEFSDWCKVYQPEITYDLILSTTVWAFPKGNHFGNPIFGCVEVMWAYISYMSDVARKMEQ